MIHIQHRVIVWVVVLCLWRCATLGRAAQLESTSTRLLFDAESGVITAVQDMLSGRSFPLKRAPLYELVLSDPATRLSSLDAETVEVKSDRNHVAIRTTWHRSFDITVVCRFHIQPHSPFLLGTMEIQSSRSIKLDTVRFPIFQIAQPFGSTGGDDVVLLPECDGCIVRNPMDHGLHKTLRYPGPASLQLLAAYDPDGGIYIASHDGNGFQKKLTAEKRNGGVRFCIDHIPLCIEKDRWSLPYDVAVSTFRSVDQRRGTTWEDAATLYRSWARKQVWCKRTLARRVEQGTVAKWLTQPHLFYAYSLRGQVNGDQRANRLPLVVEQAEAWRSVTGGPVTFMFMALERHGAWITPDYFPPLGGTSALQAVTGQLHQLGHRTLVFLSGLKWTLSKEIPGVSYNDQADFDRRGRRFAIRDRTGKAILYGRPTAGVGQYAQICPATSLAREILMGATLQCQRLGIDCVQMDQIVGGGMPVCYATDHGHPPGGGNWCAQHLLELFEQVRTAAKANDPDFAFSLEEPGEFFIPVLDIYHARDYIQGRWPRKGRGVLGVPLFTHVYHDYLLGYGGDSCQVSDHFHAGAIYQQAMNLICGKAPGVAIWTKAYAPRETDAAQLRLLRGHFELWQGAAREFLVFGQRMAMPPLKVPVQTVKFWDWRSKTSTPLEVPTVLDSAWKLPDGRRGRVVVCIAEKPVTFEVAGRETELQPGEVAFREFAAPAAPHHAP